jgi:hypothetical protein
MIPIFYQAKLADIQNQIIDLMESDKFSKEEHTVLYEIISRCNWLINHEIDKVEDNL